MSEPRKQRPCRRCLIADLPQGTALREILLERLAQIPENERVSREEYEARLQECRACSQLHEGTCAACGCYVELRAARKNKHCPLTKTS